MLPDALGATWRRQCDAFQRVVGNAGDVILSGSAASRGGGSPRPALPLAARRPMAGTNDVLNNVRDFESLRAAMPHSPGPHKYPRTRIPPARPYLSGHVVVAHMQNLFCTNWFIPRFDRGLLVQNHVQQGIMHFQCSIVFDETQFAEFIHEEADARPGRANHLRQR